MAEKRMTRRDEAVKRAFDVAVAITGLTLLSPLLLLLAVIVLASDGLPVLFRQVRVGVGGRRFVLYKFRTMRASRVGPEGSAAEPTSARVTRVGAVMRKAKLDEWPQLWNVLKGEMAVVGPRPEVPHWVAAYPEQWARVLTIRPGMTDPASILYRNEEELLANTDDPSAYYRYHILPHKLRLYDEYVSSWSLQLDLALILKTILCVFLPGRSSLRGHRASTAKRESNRRSD